MKSIKYHIAIVLGLLSFAACKDKNAEEYQKERNDQSIQQVKVVEGKYQGLVISNSDGRTVLGAMQLDVNVQIHNDQPNNGELGGPSPTINGSVEFYDKSFISGMNFENAYFSPDNRVFQAQFDIQRSKPGGSVKAPNGSGGSNLGGGSGGSGGGTATETVRITGSADGSSITGVVFGSNYSSDGGRFVLYRVDEYQSDQRLKDLVMKARPGQRDDDDGSTLVSYTGQTTFSRANASRAAHLVVQSFLKGTAEDLLNVIEPVRTVQVSLNYGATTFAFSDVPFDVRSSNFTGQMSVTVTRGGSSDTQTLSINCNKSGQDGLVCSQSTSGSGQIATSRFQADRDGTTDPGDATPGGPPVSKRYVGTAIMHLDDPKGKPEKIQFTVIYPARNSTDDLIELLFPTTEKYFNVSLVFPAGTTESFFGAKWDQRAGTLDGSYQNAGGIGVPSHSGQLQCTNYFFDKTTGPFTCTYWTSISPEIVITFKPPYR